MRKYLRNVDLLNVAALAFTLAWTGAPALAQDQGTGQSQGQGQSAEQGQSAGASPPASPSAAEEPAPDFDQAFLEDPANIETGRQVWEKQCRHCHGAAAYPGKAPKLVPGRMQPDFIYDRVTYGFRKMPAWKDVFDEHERMSVSAYIKSKEFSP